MYYFSYLELVFCSMSSSNCCFLTCIQTSQEAGWMVWYSHLFQNFPQLIVIHTVKGFGIVNKAEIDVFLELSCFFYDPADVGNLISGSSALSKTNLNIRKFSSVQFSRSVVSDSLRPCELQHTRPPCPSPTPGVHSNSRPASQWCHPAISSSVVPFSSCLQPLPASESFPMSQLFTWGGQSTGVSALASFLSKKCQGWSPSEWTGWISLKSKGLSTISSNTTVQKHQFFGAQLSSQSNLQHPYMTTGKTIALTRWTLVGKIMSLLLNMLSRLAIIFLPRSKRLLISRLQSPSTVISEPKK